MANFLKLKKWGFIVVALLALGACTKFPGKPQSGSNAGAKPNTPYSMPAQAYLALAKNQPDGERQNMLLMAAGRYIEETQFQQASDILNGLTGLSPLQAEEKTILLARVDLAKERFQAVISRLSSVHDVKGLPQYYQTEYHEMLASSYEHIGNPSYALNERMKLENLLTDDISQNINRRQLWLSLTRLPSAELDALGLETEDNQELAGWVKLAQIARQSTPVSQGMLAKVTQWQQQYPHHPANRLLPSPLASAENLLHPAPHEIALLLPLSGALAGPGNAIRDGFMAAYDADGRPSRLNIKFYDAAKGDVAQLYEQALAERADYVVGPLTKPDVGLIAKMTHPVPTLLLNDSDVRLNDNAYYFGLSPISEARQLAYRASKKGLHRALVIAPEGEWSDDVVNAFAQQWQAREGVIAGKLTYNSETDLNEAIRDFLHVSARQASAKQFHVKPALKKILEATKRRQDFDMIFLLAYPSKARQIMPLLRYYFAGDVPVYATSTVYSGNMNTMQDKDLDGIIFCDMSWVFYHQVPNKNWPESLNSYSRLYAMGMDSYALVTQLNRLILFPAITVNDNTGVLYLNAAHQIGRILAWGQFKGGVAQLISEL